MQDSFFLNKREKIEKKTDLITMILYSILTPTAVKLFKRMFNSNTPAVFGGSFLLILYLIQFP